PESGEGNKPCLWPYPHSGCFNCLWVLPLPVPERVSLISNLRAARKDQIEGAWAKYCSNLDSLPPLAKQLDGYDPSDIYTSYALTLIKHVLRLKEETKQELSLRLCDQIPGYNPIARLRNRLVQFLALDRANYDGEAVLKKLPFDAMFEERALVLSHMNLHKKALSIWMNVFNDWDKALQICDLIFQRSLVGEEGSRPISESVYHILIRLVMEEFDPTSLGIAWQAQQKVESQNDKIERVMQVLNRYGDRVDALEVLKNLPDNIPLCKLRHFFHRTMVKQGADLNQMVILLHATRTEVKNSRRSVEQGLRQSFVIDINSRCSKCRNPIGNSAIVRYPITGDILHYGCQDDIPSYSSESFKIYK
ncbi:hypothetical protein Ciccas_012400, partial [Cichlidogyrus casuarinus]